MKDKAFYTQNIGHLILEVLSRNKRIEKLPPAFSHGVNLT
jgi:hypothetical protein